MSVAAATAAPFTVLARAVQSVGQAWRGITVEQVLLAVLLGMAALAQILVRAINQSAVLAEAINAQLGAFALLFAVVVADRAVARGASSRLAYGAAVLVGAVAGVAAMFLHMHGVSHAVAAGLLAENPHYVATRTVSVLLEWLIIDGLATYVYADRREARRMTTRLHDAQLARNAQAKRLLESQLQAMQARIEPRFLFHTLAQVKRLFALDPASADRMLDDLIAYLRAAMPRMGDASSTLRNEIELARAYLNIVRARACDGLAFSIDVPERMGDARLPPMLLLPLIAQAIGDEAKLAFAGGMLRIAVDTSNGTLRIRIAGGGVALGSATDAIGGIRERLAALYGADARLELMRRDERTTEALLEIPRETPASGDR